MYSKNEERKSLNYKFTQNKDFSFRNSEEKDENKNPNKILISNSSPIKKVETNLDIIKNKKNQKPVKKNKNGILNRLMLNKLLEENKFLKQEIEIAKSNILIFQEKESQYKKTIEHMNVLNVEKEISYKNIVSLINNYKKRENELNSKLLLYSEELIKKNELINQLNQKIDLIKEQMVKLNNIISEKNKIINNLSQKKEKLLCPYELNYNNISENSISKSLNINYHKKENDAKLHYQEKTLNNLSSKFCDNIDNNYLHKKYSSNILDTPRNLKYNQNLYMNNNFTSENNKVQKNNEIMNIYTEIPNCVTRFKRKNLSQKNIIKNTNGNIFYRSSQTLGPMKKNSSYKSIGYNSNNLTLNDNKLGGINSSMNLLQYKKIVDKKFFKKLKINSDKRDIKQIFLPSSNRRLENKKNNRIIDNNTVNFDNYSYLSNIDDNYVIKNFHDKYENNQNKKGKLNKNFLISKIRNNTTENSIPIMSNKNGEKNQKKMENNKFLINDTEFDLHNSLGYITDKNNFF